MKKLSNEDRKKAEAFLIKIRPYLKTNEFVVQMSEKNRAFDRAFNIRHADKAKILLSLRADDCVKIENNNNVLYADDELYFFFKDAELLVYGAEEIHTLYIKMCLKKTPQKEQIVVISFHEEGLFE